MRIKKEAIKLKNNYNFDPERNDIKDEEES